MLRSGAESIAAALAALGVEAVFTVPSAHNLPLLSTIRAAGIRQVGCRHEQGAAHAADGWARTRGDIGVVVVSGGPGTANAMGGLYEAHFASSPVLLLTSQVEQPHLGRSRGYVHEAEQQAAMLRTVCREVVTARSQDDLGATVIRLARAARAGRPRPVALEVPLDLWDATGEFLDDALLGERAAQPLGTTAPDEADLDRAAEILSRARRPVIWAGGGVIRGGAGDQLLALAERWNAPVLTSREGRGAVPESHPRCLGGYATLPPLAGWLGSCDAMLAVGTRFQMYPTDQWRLPVPAGLVHLDVDPSVPGRSYPAQVSLIGDAGAGLAALTVRLATDPDGDDERDAHLTAGRRAAQEARDLVAKQCGPDHLRLSRSVAARRPASGVLVCDATIPAYVWGDRLVPIERPRTSIRSAAAGIGPGMAMALGAALASDEHTILLAGDGGFMLGIAELASAVQAEARVVICLFDDHGYGMLRDIGGSEDPGFTLATPDFAAAARSFGARADHVADPDGFDAAFARALVHHGPTLIHVDMAGLAPLDRTAGLRAADDPSTKESR